MVQIIPAILATTEEDYQKRIQQIEESGLFKNKWVHVDLMDNKFVQNKSIGPEIVAKYPINSNLEAHLMAQEPYVWVEELIRIGVKRVIIPAEIPFKEVDRILDMVQDTDIEVGLALNPETEVSRLEPYLDRIDVVLIMSVHPGFQGQEFIPESIEKIKEVLRLRSGQIRFKIEFDGGISEENAKQVVDAGADYLVVGSGLFKYDNLENGLKRIQEAINV